MAAILIVEDSPTHTTLMRSLLEDESHEVTCVTNGQEALDLLQRSDSSNRPQLVVTDLRMPEMNGQELVQEIAQRIPQLPTVVVTARGSESLAVDALALGAANFVPKNSLSKLLTHVVRQTLELSRADGLYEGFTGRLTLPEFSISLSNDLVSIQPAVSYVIHTLAAATKMNPTQRIRVATATASALFNAMCYGNLELADEDSSVGRLLSGDESGIHDLNALAAAEPYSKRTVELKVSVGEDDTRILVGHTGPGRIMMRMTPAPGTPESFELEECRGLMLMSSFMDDVIFQTGCSEVVMVKKHA